MQPLQICIGPTIRIVQESWCLPYAGFLRIPSQLFPRQNNITIASKPLMKRREQIIIKYFEKF